MYLNGMTLPYSVTLVVSEMSDFVLRHVERPIVPRRNMRLSFLLFSDIIAQVFFPESDDEDDRTNLIRTFCIFGGAFVMRPLGGLLIGYVGDKHGRKTALTHSLFLMAVPTTLMGCLPSYETAGVFSIILLALCRIVQGLSVGSHLLNMWANGEVCSNDCRVSKGWRTVACVPSVYCGKTRPETLGILWFISDGKHICSMVSFPTLIVL